LLPRAGFFFDMTPLTSFSPGFEPSNARRSDHPQVIQNGQMVLIGGSQIRSAS